MAVLIAAFSQFVYADSACPKGKECTTRGCGRYSDTNGNNLCDIAEGISSDSGTSDQSLIADANDSSSSNQEISTDSDSTASSPADYAIQFIKDNMLILSYAMFLIVAAFLYGINIKRNARDRIRLFLLALSLGTLGFYFGGCICPIGALQNLPLRLAGIVSGQYILWLILVLLPIVFIFLAGRVFCSSVCPLGAVQELTFRIGKKLGLNHGKPGLERIKWLRYIKYAVLVWLIVFTAITGYTLFCRYDPFLTLFTFSGTLISTLLLAVVLISSLFVSRPWCRIICPYGALLGIINKISMRKENIKCSSCNGCGMCTTECPVDAISVSKDKSGSKVPEIDYFECINCKKCQ